MPFGETTTPGPLVSTTGHRSFGAVVVVVVEASAVVVVVSFDARDPSVAPGFESELHAASRATTTAATAAHPAIVVGQSFATMSAMSSPHSVGFRPTLAPASRSASIFAAAVPLPPETMAPAWPIFLPGGAVTPAM